MLLRRFAIVILLASPMRSVEAAREPITIIPGGGNTSCTCPYVPTGPGTDGGSCSGYCTTTTTASTTTTTIPLGRRDPIGRDTTDSPKANSQAAGTDKNAPGMCPAPSTLSSDPVDLATGSYYDTLNLMLVAAAGAPLHVTLNYNSGNTVAGSVGFGWGHPYQYNLANGTNGSIRLTWPDRHVSGFSFVVNLQNPGDGRYVNFANPAETLVKQTDGSYTLTDRRQKTYNFDANGRLVRTVDRLGFIRDFAYLVNGNLDRVTDALSGRFLQFGYDTYSRVSSVSSTGAGTVALAYSVAGDLSSVTDALGNVTSFTYDASHRLLTKVNALGATIVTNTYDASRGRVILQDDGLNTTPLERFNYGTYASGSTYTSYQDRAGGITQHGFNSASDPLKIVDTTVDPLGGQEFQIYDAATGTRTAYQDSLYRQTRFTYDTSGYVLSRTDALGQVASYTYDAAHNILSITDEAGKVTSMNYGANRQLLSRTDPLGGVTTYTYNAQGLPATVTSPTGGVTRYTYDAQGHLTGKLDPAGSTTSYTYDAAGRMLTRTDGQGNVWSWTYDLMERVLSATDPLGNTARYTYDALGRVATQTAPGGGIRRYAYDIHGNLVSLTDPLGSVTSYAYDANDRLIRITDALGRIARFTRDAKGRIVGVSDPFGNVTTRSYNKADELVGTRDALNNQIAFTYDAVSRLTAVTDPLNYSTTQAYDAVGRVIKRTDTKGKPTTFGYDTLGRLVSAIDALGGKASQAFDLNGNRVSFTDANGNVTTLTWDAANRLTRIATADGGATSFTYNNRNLVANATNGRGQAATYTYDAAGRLVTLADPAGTTSLTYDANSNVLTVGDARGSATYTYDLLNRITSYTDVFGNRIGYRYDAMGNLTALTYPGNKVVTYAYDAANRMVSVTDWSGHTTTYTYDVRGKMTAITRANGTKGAYAYDAKGQITSIIETASPISGFTNRNAIAYTYDASGNITSEVTDPISAIATPVTAAAGMAYGSDNRLSSINGLPVLHDADGNMTSGPLMGVASTYSFDARSRLTGVGGSTYVYDAQSIRVSATNAGAITRYVVDPNAVLSRVLMETDGAGTPIAYYVHGLGLISRESAAGTYQTYHYDLRGSTLALKDSRGIGTDSYRYGPYGELVFTEGTTANPFRYNGRDGVITEPNGLYYMRARYYLPEARRFVSRDMLLGSVEQTLTLNRFAFVNGNPIGFIDPTGRFALLIVPAVYYAVANAAILCAVTQPCSNAIVAGVGLLASLAGEQQGSPPSNITAWEFWLAKQGIKAGMELLTGKKNAQQTKSNFPSTLSNEGASTELAASCDPLVASCPPPPDPNRLCEMGLGSSVPIGLKP